MEIAQSHCCPASVEIWVSASFRSSGKPVINYARAGKLACKLPINQPWVSLFQFVFLHQFNLFVGVDRGMFVENKTDGNRAVIKRRRKKSRTKWPLSYSLDIKQQSYVQVSAEENVEQYWKLKEKPRHFTGMSIKDIKERFKYSWGIREEGNKYVSTSFQAKLCRSCGIKIRFTPEDPTMHKETAAAIEWKINVQIYHKTHYTRSGDEILTASSEFHLICPWSVWTRAHDIALIPLIKLPRLEIPNPRPCYSNVN